MGASGRASWGMPWCVSARVLNCQYRLALLVGIGCLAIGCRHPTQGPQRPGPQRPVLKRSELLARLASDPTDREAHLGLARLYLHDGMRGRALAHFVSAGSRRESIDNDSLADLYLERAALRLADDDPDGLADLGRMDALQLSQPWRKEHASRLHELTQMSIYAAAAAAFRRSNRQSLARATALLTRAVREFGPSPRAAAASPELKPLVEVGKAGAWLAREGAKKRALELLDQYVGRGGHQPEILEWHQRLKEWWGREPISEPDADALLAVALESWLQGQTSSWLAEHDAILRSIDPTTVTVGVRPTVLRTQGKFHQSRSALIAVLAELEQLPTNELAIVRMECAIQGLEWPRRVQLRGQLGALASLRALAVEATANDSLVECAEQLNQARNVGLRDDPIGLGARYCIAVGNIDTAAQWSLSAEYSQRRAASIFLRPMLSRQPNNETTNLSGQNVWLTPLGTPNPFQLVFSLNHPLRSENDAVNTAARLAMLIRQYIREPIIAERLAHDWIAESVWPAARLLLVYKLFVRLGDPARGARFISELLALSPNNASFLTAAAISAARTKDYPLAKVNATLAAARSGDAGKTLRELTVAFANLGALLPAIWAGRKALMLSAPRHHQQLARVVAVAMLAAGRRRDAAELLVDDPDREIVLATRSTRADELRLMRLRGISRDQRLLWGKRFPTDAMGVVSLLAGDSRFDRLHVRQLNDQDAQMLKRALLWNPGSPPLLAVASGLQGRFADAAYRRLAEVALYRGDSSALLWWSRLAVVKGQQAASRVMAKEAASSTRRPIARAGGLR